MTQNRWITPGDSAPTDYICRRLLIPNSIDWIGIVNGALDELSQTYNFEQIDGITAQETADTFWQMFLRYSETDWCMIGAIIPYATTDAPAGTLACDGSTYLRVDYPDLYNVLASAFIVDADTFNVPDLRGRGIIGAGDGAGLTSRSVGDTGGAERVTLDVSEIPSHSHSESGAVGTIINGGLEAPASSATPFPTSTGAAGGGASHDNMMPWEALGYAIIAG